MTKTGISGVLERIPKGWRPVVLALGLVLGLLLASPELGTGFLIGLFGGLVLARYLQKPKATQETSAPAAQQGPPMASAPQQQAMVARGTPTVIRPGDLVACYRCGNPMDPFSSNFCKNCGAQLK